MSGACDGSTTAPDAPATWIRTDAATYLTDGDAVVVTVTNLSDVALSGGLVCNTALEKWTGSQWIDGPQQPILGHGCPSGPELMIGPGSTRADTIPLGQVDVGLYRFRLDGLYGTAEQPLTANQRVTNAFRTQ